MILYMFSVALLLITNFNSPNVNRTSSNVSLVLLLTILCISSRGFLVYLPIITVDEYLIKRLNILLMAYFSKLFPF